MDQEKYEPKISLPEAIYVGLFILTADALEAGLLLFGLDDFGISDVIAFPATQIYLRMKGVRGSYMLMGNIAEVFPYVGWMPMRSISYWATVIVDHNPQLGRAVTTVTAVTKGETTTATGTPATGASTTTVGASAGGATSTTATPSLGASAPPPPPAAAERPSSTDRGVTETGESSPAATTPEAGAQGKPPISEEQFGVEKEPIEKLQELMEKAPEAEDKKEQEEEEEEEPTASATNNEEENKLL